MNRHGSMNRIYRLVWSQVRAAWVPVAENAKGRGKSGRARVAVARALMKRTALMTALPLAFVSLAQAAPSGGKVVGGVGSITQAGNTTDVTQSSQNLSINWQSFNVALQETVNFLQPSASAIAVNRISGNSGSQILGHLNANGQVYLINPNGILFGQGAQVNVGGLVASTLDLNDASFIGSAKSFSGTGPGSVVNQGTITAANGGYVALLGNHVSNQGLITAKLGTVALAAGSAVTLTFSGNSLVQLQVDRSVLDSLAENGGMLRADGGQVVMTAGAKDTLLASVVNNTGLIEARTVENHGGTITLLGGMGAGTVNVGGTLDASAPEGGNGGYIETSGAHVEVAGGAKVTTASSQGLYGSWLIDPQDFTVAASGGDISGATLSAELGSTSVTLQSSSGQGAGSGNVNVNDPVAWNANTALTLTASNNVNVNASITATGATAGLILNPNTANGSEAASGAGTFNLGAGASINLPNVSPTSATALVISGTPYTVINSLGAAGSTTGTDLQGINGNLSGHYALGSNIDATPTSAWNAGAGFLPIGASYTTPFAGTMEGLGHTVSNLSINRPTTDNVGLFGFATVSVIRNIGLTGGAVSGGNYVGALLGFNYGGTITNAHSDVSVTGSNDVGGLVGSSQVEVSAATGYSAGTISNSDASGSVTGVKYVGGLVGYNHGNVSNSHATGSVRGSDYVGGLVGFIYGNYQGLSYGTYQTIGVVSQSYAMGSVSGSTNVGGLVGGINGGYGGSVSGSHATGDVSGTGNVGGLVGYIAGGNSNYGTVGTITNSYATGHVSATDQNAGGLVGLNSATISNSYATGAVSGANYVGGLVGYDGGWSGNYRTDGTIGTVVDSFATGSVTGNTGVGGLVGFNGGGSGFYGVVGTVKNSYATGNVSGNGSVGGLVGHNSNYQAIITDSHASGSVTGTGNDVGGLVGLNDSNYGVSSFGPAFGPIKNSYSTGSVTGSTNVGGLVGYNYGSISNSYSTGSVVGTANVGGLAGFSSGPVATSYATGSVGGNDSVGGLVGANGALDTTTISDTYATGSVTGTTNVGGLVGNNIYGGLINNSFWDVTSSGLTTSAGGIGMTTAQMQTQANFTSATAANGNVNPNWDFATTWVMYDGHTYPLLSSFMTPLTVTANSGTTTYNGSAYSGANGVTYSVAPNSNLLGTLTYGSSPQPAINVGSYVITPGGLYSNQQGYNIHYASGTLTINQLASVAWTGGSTGNWSNAANWAGGAIPDYANVAAVTIPSGTTVTYDGGVPGATALSTLTSSGNLIMAAGKLGTSGNLSTQGFVQSGGTLNVGGSFTINSSNGGVTLGNIVAGSMNVSSRAGAITQLASTALDVNGAGSFSADNGASGTSEIRYGVKLGNAANNFVGPVSLNGANVSVTDSSGGLILGNTTATGTLIATSRGWEITQAAGTAIDALGASFFTADNGASGAGEIRYGVKLGNAANNFVGAVSFNGANVIVDDAGGGLVFGYTTTTGTLTAVSRGGQITQAAGTTINALGASFFTADNGVSGAGDIRYGINLGNAANNFVGAVSLYGANINVNDASGGLVLGYTTAGGTLTAVSRGGQITQAAGTAINAYGASSFTADNGASGAGEIRYGVKLGNTGNNFGGAVSLNGANININDANGGLIFGNTTATGTLTAVSRGGQITQAAGTAIKANQASSFTADNGAGGASDVQYRIILANAANTFGGAVSAGGSSITLNSASPLTANVNSTQSVALTSAGKLAVSGTIHDNLTTVTTGGTGSTTTFGTTTVGANLNVTSPGVVTTVTPSTPLTVHGAGTHTPNPHVTVNHVVGALID